VLQHYLGKEETQKTAHWCLVLCIQHSPTSAALSTSFLLDHAPPQKKSPELNAVITRLRESYSSMMSRESKRLKNSSSNWLNSGSALIQRVKNAIFVFPVVPHSAEVQVTGGGIESVF